MPPVEARTEPAIKTFRDALREAVDKHGVLFDGRAHDALLKAQARAYEQKVCVTPIHIVLALNSFDAETNNLLTRAELNWTRLDHLARNNKKIDPISHSQTPITNGFTEVVDQAAKNAKDSNTHSVVQPFDLLKAVLRDRDVTKELGQDEGVMERINDEIDLYEGQQELAETLQLLTNERLMTRKDRKDLLAKLQEATKP